MRGYLFGDYPFTGDQPVYMLPQAIAIGGSWEGHPQTYPPLAHDDDLIKLVYEYLKPLDHPVLLDVGANTGSFSLLPVLLPDLTVYSFEPNRDVFALLEHHIRMNRLTERVRTYNIAAWHEQATLTLSVPLPTATGCATLGTPNGGVPTSQQQVEALPLDWLMNSIPHVDFIKIDVEGAEKFVLQGAAKLIARDRPLLLIECTWTTGLLFNYDRQDILDLVTSWGYRCTYPKEDNALCVPN